ncbi:MAG: hypothetical protein CL946_13305 [Ectothiorhodospiraceae bacterium]|nr:hypothetical protein [Ectothiorhodospiraceae bacterium]
MSDEPLHMREPGIDTGELDVQVDTVDGVEVVRVAGKILSSNVHTLESVVQDLIGKEKLQIAFDLTEVPYMSSAGVRVILLCAKSMQKRNGSFALFGLSEYNMKVFEVAGLHSILPIMPDWEETKRFIESANG